MGSKNLLRVDKEKDLGVDVCANFKWDVHTHTIIGKANRMLGLLKQRRLDSYHVNFSTNQITLFFTHLG